MLVENHERSEDVTQLAWLIGEVQRLNKISERNMERLSKPRESGGPFSTPENIPGG